MMQGYAWGIWLLIEGLTRKKSSKLLLLYFQYSGFLRNTDNFSFKMPQTNAWNADFTLLLCFPFYGIRVYVNYIYRGEEYVAWSKIASSALAKTHKDFAPSLQIESEMENLLYKRANFFPKKCFTWPWCANNSLSPLLLKKKIKH